MQYILSFSNPQSRYLRIDAYARRLRTETLTIQLPAWRPGRYELGNFAKNVRDFRAFDINGNPLACKKITKDAWEIATQGKDEVHLSYEYYAADLNAGSTYLDDSQLYVNPVNCLVYMPDRMNDACTVELRIADDWKIACSLPQPKKNTLQAENFDRLADSPFIASGSLKHDFFLAGGVEFHLWFQGECKPDWTKLVSDFFVFTAEQISIFGHFPAERYNFYFQILPTRFYHGVEHLDSTVIALGPPHKLMQELYKDLLGVSCHELFHAWNIKAIRPAEMYPYDLTKENYSRLGFVCEGVTTYYGDYLLYRSGVWTAEDFWPTFDERIQKHVDSHARYLMSVADASFDTWLDGYVPGAPHRKTSIYHEGCLLAFITDIFIRKHSQNKNTLDQVMRRLYDDYARQGKGYTERDYKRLVEEYAGADFTTYWKTYFYAANDYLPALTEALDYIGYDLVRIESRKPNESQFGFKVAEHGQVTKVTEIYYGSPAEVAGLALGDELVTINAMPVRAELAEWINYFADEAISLQVISAGLTKTITLERSKTTWFPHYRVQEKAEISGEMTANRAAWNHKI